MKSIISLKAKARLFLTEKVDVDLYLYSTEKESIE